MTFFKVTGYGKILQCIVAEMVPNVEVPFALANLAKQSLLGIVKHSNIEQIEQTSDVVFYLFTAGGIKSRRLWPVESQAKMKLLSVFALSALSTAEEALNRSKRQEDPATCRANCQSDFDYSFIDDLDACFAGCGTGGIPDMAEEEGSCQK